MIWKSTSIIQGVAGEETSERYVAAWSELSTHVVTACRVISSECFSNCPWCEHYFCKFEVQLKCYNCFLLRLSSQHLSAFVLSDHYNALYCIYIYTLLHSIRILLICFSHITNRMSHTFLKWKSSEQKSWHQMDSKSTEEIWKLLMISIFIFSFCLPKKSCASFAPVGKIFLHFASLDSLSSITSRSGYVNHEGRCSWRLFQCFMVISACFVCYVGTNPWLEKCSRREVKASNFSWGVFQNSIACAFMYASDITARLLRVQQNLIAFHPSF